MHHKRNKKKYKACLITLQHMQTQLGFRLHLELFPQKVSLNYISYHTRPVTISGLEFLAVFRYKNGRGT